MRVFILLLLCCCGVLPGVSAPVDAGPEVAKVRIDSVSLDGGLIELDDGSTWMVHELDRNRSAMWIPFRTLLSVRTRDSVAWERLFIMDSGSYVRVLRLWRE